MKTARYHGLRDRVMAGVDQVHAESVLIKFNRDGITDPSRPAVEIEAVLRVGGGKETAASGNRIDAAWRTRITAQRAELHIDRTKYSSIEAKHGDEVRALSRPGEPWFEVLAVDDRGMSRLVLQLGETV